MKALVRNDFQKLNYVDMPMPEIKESNDVKVKILYSSFCRDDMRCGDKNDIFLRPGIIGHEAVGIVEEVGDIAAFNGYNQGDIVIILPWSSCGHCFQCLSHKSQYCEQSSIHQGVTCQYIVSKATQLFKVPSNMTYKQAVMIEPIACVIETISTLNINYHSRVAVIGAGVAGLSFIKLLKLRGAKEITVVEPIEQRREQAKDFGADHAIDPASSDFKYKFSNSSNHEGFDVIIETSSDIDMANLSFSYLRKGGILKLYTYYGNQKMMSIPLFSMYYSNMTISCSSLCSLKSMIIAADRIVRLSLDQLITFECTFEEALDAYNMYKTCNNLKIGIKYA